MKKIFLIIIIFCINIIHVSASEIPNFSYKNISDNSPIFFNQTAGQWEFVKKKKSVDYYEKKQLCDDKFVFLDSNGKYVFDIDVDRIFIKEGRLLGYSNSKLKIFEYVLVNNSFVELELDKIAVQELFPKYQVICISDFNQNTNSLKVRKSMQDLNILLLNDSDISYSDYSFSSGNAKYKTYFLKGFITVKKRGMIQFSGDDKLHWFVILVK